MMRGHNPKTSGVDLLSTSQRLKSQQDVLDKAQEQAIKKLKVYGQNEYNDLHSIYRALHISRMKDAEEQQTSLVSIIKSLKQLKEDLNNVEFLQLFDVSNFRKRLKDLEKIIFSMIETTQKQSKILVTKEEQLMEEVDKMEWKIEEWDSLGAPVSRASLNAESRVSRDICQDSLPCEVKEFEKFLEENGEHTGGWSSSDHQIFLKLHSKHGPDTLPVILNKLLPDIEKEEVIAHEAWYSQYLQLQQLQREAIQTWRNRKQERQISASLPISAMEKKKVCRDPLQKSRIEQWKAMQKAKKEAEREEGLKQERCKKQEGAAKKERQEQKKALVNQYKEEKLGLEQSLELARKEKELVEEKKKNKHANAMLKLYRQEDRKRAERLHSRRLMHTLQVERREEQLREMSECVSVKAVRDPSRLLQPTEGWKEKCKKEEEESSNNIQLNLNTIPRLKVPAWRQGFPSGAAASADT